MSMNGQMETKLGKVTIDPEVIALYAGSVAVECFGIVGMAAVNMKDGLVKLLKKDYLTHGINVSVNEDNKITIDFHVIVSYGVSISTVTDNLIETVRYKVEEFTGMVSFMVLAGEEAPEVCMTLDDFFLIKEIGRAHV